MNTYTENEYEIFSRLFILNEFSEENLKILSKIRIGIVGMGGIGCPLSQYLVNSGIKELLLVDGDRVEKSNLNISPEDRNIVLIDDVIYTGRTLRASIEAVMHS